MAKLVVSSDTTTTTTTIPVREETQPPMKRAAIYLAKLFSDLDWRLLLLIITPLSLIVFFSLSPSVPTTTFAPIRSFILSHTFPSQQQQQQHIVTANNSTAAPLPWRKDELDRARIAVCLVGGVRRFELTGPSIVEKILRQYPNSDLYLNCPADTNSFKLSLLKSAPRIAAVRIFWPKPMPESESELRVLTAHNSPNGIQGLLQYFNLVEGCLPLIQAYQKQNNFTYDWVVRTRVDGYWNAPLDPKFFVPGQYLVPPGTNYFGLNDRFGVGDLNTSIVALSRLSLIPQLDAAGFRQLNSEAAFKAQLTTQGVPFVQERLPFCIVTDRKYEFPPARYGVPVAALSSRGPLSGIKCRPCKPACKGKCVGEVMERLIKGWSWTHWDNGALELCNASGDWDQGWEKIFDLGVGKKMSAERKRVGSLTVEKCIADFNEMKSRTGNWDTPPVDEICRIGVVASGPKS